MTVVILSCVTTTGWAEEPQADPQIDFNIPQQRAELALTEFAEQADLTLAVPRDVLLGKEANALIGSYTLQEGIDVLLAGTGLIPEFSNQIVLSIETDPKSVGEGKTMKSPKKATGLAAALASIFAGGASAQELRTTDGEGEEFPEELEEIIVTGTNIRGAAPVGSPLISLNREDIDKTGLSTIQDVVQTLPQAVGAGPNADTSSIDGIQSNFGLGSSINLRGVGADRTLTLIDGRRNAPAGTDGGFVDISQIPLTAIERVEVLTDGASALYGSDAIGGVVNIILRDDFQGAETTLRYGAVTDGGLDEIKVGQLLGTNWGSGNILVAYEFFTQDPLLAVDRDFAASSDLTPFGGDNFNDIFANPGTILTGGDTFAIPEGQDGTALTPGDLTPGTENLGNRKEGTTIFPEQERHSAFLAAQQQLGERLELFAEGRFTRRDFRIDFRNESRTLTVPDTNPFFVDPVGGNTSVQVRYSFSDDLGPQTQEGDVTTLNFTGGANVKLFGDWFLELYGSLSDEETSSFNDNRLNTFGLDAALADNNPGTAFNPFGDGSNTNSGTIDALRGFATRDIDSELWSIRGKADGTILQLPGGDVKLAIGLEYFENTLATSGLSLLSTAAPESRDTFDGSRDASATFGELYIPVVGTENAVTGISRLEVSVAGRFTDYSDFGTTWDPKVGALWSPVDGVTFRGSFGTSFRAPLLPELDDSDASAFALPLADPTSTSGFSTALILFGGNAGLAPEEATTWSAGADFAPGFIEGLNFSVTYFDIDLTNRILAIGGGDALTALSREGEFAAVITRNPSMAEAQVGFDFPLFFDFAGGVSPADIDVLIDGRLSNVSVTNINGLDFLATYDVDLGNQGALNFGLNGSYLFKFEEALTPTSEFFDVLNTVGRPTDLRLRGSVGWTRDGLSSSIFVNHVGDYTDSISTPERSVNSWTTVDLNLAYDTGQDLGLPSWLGNTVFSVSVQNLFDEDPPFVNNALGVGYDPANSDPRGRFVAFQITKGW